jgi:FAD binding domain-containing protein
MPKYDLIVVGSGPAGQRAAIQAAKFGKRAAPYREGSTPEPSPARPSAKPCCISPGRFVQEMVKMSPLQGSRFEVTPASDEMGIIGAAVNAAQAPK